MSRASKTDTLVPNDLEAFWMPFTASRAFKKRPRLVVRAKDMHYFTPEGRPVLDAAAGMWCCNAGHNREPIVEAIRAEAGVLDYAPPFQCAQPKAFALASRIAALAPGDLDSSAASAAITASASAAFPWAASSPTAATSARCSPASIICPRPTIAT